MFSYMSIVCSIGISYEEVIRRYIRSIVDYTGQTNELDDNFKACVRVCKLCLGQVK